jgi:hypothetical protein
MLRVGTTRATMARLKVRVRVKKEAKKLVALAGDYP